MKSFKMTFPTFFLYQRLPLYSKWVRLSFLFFFPFFLSNLNSKSTGLLKLEYWVTENPVVWFVICAGFGSVLGFVIVTFCLDDSFFEIEEEEGKKKVEKKQKKKPKSE